jgi:GxxExxY protein
MEIKDEHSSLAFYINKEFPKSEKTGRIIAAAQAVHYHLGPGFEEKIYQRALALELIAQGLDYNREVEIDIHYRDQIIGTKRVDFIIEDIMVELKAKAQIEDVHVVQALSYIKASNFSLGLLLNFGAKKLEIKRLINSQK